MNQQAAAQPSRERAIVGVQVRKPEFRCEKKENARRRRQPLAAEFARDLYGENGLLHFRGCELTARSAWGLLTKGASVRRDGQWQKEPRIVRLAQKKPRRP